MSQNGQTNKTDQVCLSILEYYALTLWWRRSLSYRNQSNDLFCKSISWFLYDLNLCHEGVKSLKLMGILLPSKIIKWTPMKQLFTLCAQKYFQNRIERNISKLNLKMALQIAQEFRMKLSLPDWKKNKIVATIKMFVIITQKHVKFLTEFF